MGGCGLKLKFMGMIEKDEPRRSCCGGRRISQSVMRREKKMMLPSGRAFTFKTGVVAEVSENDGEFLLSLNGKRPAFVEVV